MPKHTPGPWSVQEPTRNVLAPPTPYLPDGMIAATRYLGNAPERATEHEANARLIAAAPDLLEALRRLTANEPREFNPEEGTCCFYCREEANTWGDIKHAPDCEWLLARAAIAKAERREDA